MSLLKKIARTLLALCLGTAIACCVFYATHTSLARISTVEEITDFDNVAPALPLNERNAVKKSRKSTVQVLSLSYDGVIASSTGTYIKNGDRYFIFTVAHGLAGPCDDTKVWTPEDGIVDCIDMLAYDPALDYAIMEITEIPSRTPINIRRSLPKASEWKQALSSQTKVYYTGYPNSAGPLTVPGTIVGYDSSDYIYLYSYAFSGASGSGVFTTDGKLIGYLLAIDVGVTEFGIQALESVVIVVPTFKVDWTSIMN